MKQDERRSACPVNFALETFGDSWSLLIMRDILLRGKRTFGELHASEEGIATNILTDRLAKLKATRIIDHKPIPGNTRGMYVGTKKGVDLIPLLFEMVLWSAKYDPETGAPREFVEAIKKRRGKTITAAMAGKSIAYAAPGAAPRTAPARRGGGPKGAEAGRMTKAMPRKAPTRQG